MVDFGINAPEHAEHCSSTEPEKCRLTLLGTFPPSSFSSSNSVVDGETVVAGKSTDRSPAIVRVEKTAFSPDCATELFSRDSEGLVRKVELMQSTDIVRLRVQRSFLFVLALLLNCNGSIRGSRAGSQLPLLLKRNKLMAMSKSTLYTLQRTSTFARWLSPFTNCFEPSHRGYNSQYSAQQSILVRETPELFEIIVKPYILNFPPKRTQWYDTLYCLSCRCLYEISFIPG